MYAQIDSNKRKTWILMVLFIIIVIAIGYILDNILGYGGGIMVIAVLYALIMTLIGYFNSDKIALRVAGAKPITKEENPYVYRLVENLCITAGIPIPKIYIINDEAMNAFATGRDPKHASIALTKGIVDKLENEELEGVIAHELSHIKNYDIRLMTITAVLVGSIIMMTDIFLRSGFGGRSDRKSNPLAIVGIIFIVLSPLFAKLIQLAISRKREYLADASGSLLTRYPEGLANALEKISQQNLAIKKTSPAIAHLYIANPFAKRKNFVANLFSTHPPLEERIAKLRTMA